MQFSYFIRQHCSYGFHGDHRLFEVEGALRTRSRRVRSPLHRRERAFVSFWSVPSVEPSALQLINAAAQQQLPPCSDALLRDLKKWKNEKEETTDRFELVVVSPRSHPPSFSCSLCSVAAPIRSGSVTKGAREWYADPYDARMWSSSLEPPKEKNRLLASDDGFSTRSFIFFPSSLSPSSLRSQGLGWSKDLLKQRKKETRNL